MRKPILYTYWGKNYRFRWLPYIYRRKLMWKDKFATPRCEMVPQFKIEFLWWVFLMEWGCDQYWEQWLWVTEYNGGDYLLAEETWGWTDMNTGKSTWDGELL